MERSVREAWQLARRAVADAGALALPEQCAGCRAPGLLVCAACRGELAPRPQRVNVGGDLEVWTGIAFDGAAASILRAVKRDARPRLAAYLAPILAAALRELARSGRAAPESLLVVPVPASGQSLRARGFRVVDLVARHAGVRPRRLLALHRSTADQRGLGRVDRLENLRGGMVVRGAHGLRVPGLHIPGSHVPGLRVQGLLVVIVDDVVTTGATLIEAARALRAAGAVVVGAATIAATPLRGRTGDASETRR